MGMNGTGLNRIVSSSSSLGSSVFYCVELFLYVDLVDRSNSYIC